MHHHQQNSPFRAIIFLRKFYHICLIRPPGLHFFGFHFSIFFFFSFLQRKVNLTYNPKPEDQVSILTFPTDRVARLHSRALAYIYDINLLPKNTIVINKSTDFIGTSWSSKRKENEQKLMSRHQNTGRSHNLKAYKSCEMWRSWSRPTWEWHKRIQTGLHSW